MSAVSDDQVSRRALRRKRERRRGWVAFIRDIAVILVIALVVSWLVKTFVVRSFYIPSGSMKDTLQIDDRILVDEITPRFGGYDRGDIVVFRDPGGWLPSDPAGEQDSGGFLAEAGDWVLGLFGLSTSDSSEHLVKRIIGIPGDHVVCCNALGQIEVNGTPLDERAYVRLNPGESAPRVKEFDVTVPPNSYWVMGDNRDNSEDSRFHMSLPGKGFVPHADIVGRAFLRTWPFSRFGGLTGPGDTFDAVADPSEDEN